MPAGFDKAGAPIGVQLIGPHLGEASLLTAGHAFQTVTDWHARRAGPVRPAPLRGRASDARCSSPLKSFWTAPKACAAGRDVVFDRVDPAKTALVVVDLQNGFMEEGAPVEAPVAREIVPNVNRIATALRAAGGTVVFLRYTNDATDPTPWIWYDGMLGEGVGRGHARHLQGRRPLP